MAEITTGSVAFFDGMAGFKPKLTDKVEIVKSVPNGWWKHKQTKEHVRIFEWQRHTVSELVEKLTACTDCKRVTTLLVPAFAQAIAGESVLGGSPAKKYLTAIAPAVAKLCDRHEWGTVIYEAYKQNGALTLTDEQRAEAYEAYKTAHGETTND